MLLTGESGTGKTMAARYIGQILRHRCNFLNIQCTDIVNKIVGRSEQVLFFILKMKSN